MWIREYAINMKLSFLLYLIVGVGVQGVFCDGIQTPLGGSENCPDLSLQSFPVSSAKYRHLLILNSLQRNNIHSFKDFRVLSVKYVTVSDQKRSPVVRILKRWSIQQTPYNNFGFLQV